MTAGQFRRVVGYPAYSFTTSYGTLAASGVVTYNLPSGPGEILGFGILKYLGLNTDFHYLIVTITIDGAVIYNGYLCVLSLMNLSLSSHNQHATNDIQTADLASYSHRFRYAYESSAVIAFTNGSLGSLDLAVGIHSRRGA